MKKRESQNRIGKEGDDFPHNSDKADREKEEERREKKRQIYTRYFRINGYPL